LGFPTGCYLQAIKQFFFAPLPGTEEEQSPTSTTRQQVFLAPLPVIEEEEAPTSTTRSHVNYAPVASFLAPLPGRKKTFVRGVSHAHPLLCFLFCFTLFLLASFYKKYKKISFLYS
jgi:hypothetical protein